MNVFSSYKTKFSKLTTIQAWSMSPLINSHHLNEDAWHEEQEQKKHPRSNRVFHCSWWWHTSPFSYPALSWNHLLLYFPTKVYSWPCYHSAVWLYQLFLNVLYGFLHPFARHPPHPKASANRTLFCRPLINFHLFFPSSSLFFIQRNAASQCHTEKHSCTWDYICSKKRRRNCHAVKSRELKP